MQIQRANGRASGRQDQLVTGVRVSFIDLSVVIGEVGSFSRINSDFTVPMIDT